MINNVQFNLNNMSIPEMKSRIKEIDKIRQELNEERRAYSNYMSNKSEEEKLEDRQKYINKYYARPPLTLFPSSSIKNDDIIAFKILEVTGPYSAKMLAITKDDTIKFTEMSVWGPRRMSLMGFTEEEMWIDTATEISKEEFMNIYNKVMEKVVSALEQY